MFTHFLQHTFSACVITKHTIIFQFSIVILSWFVPVEEDDVDTESESEEEPEEEEAPEPEPEAEPEVRVISNGGSRFCEHGIGRVCIRHATFYINDNVRLNRHVLEFAPRRSFADVSGTLTYSYLIQ